MPRAGRPNTGRALCAVVAECCLLLSNSPYTGETATPTSHLHSPAATAPSAGPTTPAAHSRGCVLPCSAPWPCPGLATHTLAGLCALWLVIAASSSGNFHKPAKPHPQQTTCTAPLPLPPVQAPSHLLHIVETAFDLAVPHGMSRAGHPRTGRALCAVVAECCLLLWNSPRAKLQPPTSHLPGPAAGPSAGPTTPAAHSRGCI